MQYKIQYDNNGNPQEVIIEEDIFKGHEDENPRYVVRKYLENIVQNTDGAFATIMESGQKVYLGEDLPGEYSYSKSSKTYKGEKFNVKGQIAQGLHEAIEIATNRKWEKNTKNKHEIDAKYGWYKYETRLKVNNTPYSAVLLIRNDADGKKYLYDVLSVNKTGTTREASNLDGSAMNGNSSYTNNTTGAEESQGEFAYKDADVPNTPFADALGDIDISSIYEEGKNDTGNDFQNKVITPVSPSVNQGLTPPSSEGGSGQIELKGRGEFDSDEAYAHYINEVGQKEFAKVPKITRAFLEAIARRTGLKIVIGDTGTITGQKSAGGYSRSRDMLVLDYDTVSSPDKLARAVINHELVHATETSMFYKSLEKHAFEQMFGGDEKALNDAIKKKQERYARSGVKLGRDGAKAELVARYIGESVLTSEAAINRLVIEKPTLAMQIKNALVKTYDKAKTYFTDKEAYEARYAMSDLEKGIRLFEKALDTRRNFKDYVQRLSGNVGGDVQYFANGSEKSASIKEQLANEITELSNMKNVKDINYELKGSDKAEKRNSLMQDLLSELDLNVTREGLGEVVINKKLLKESFKYLNTDEEYVAFWAIPEVIKNGKQVYYNANHKNRGYPTYTFAAPVMINGKKGYMGVSVRVTDGNKYKMHRVLFPDGATLEFTDNKNAEATTPAPLSKTTDIRTITSTPEIITEDASNVKNDFQFAAPVAAGVQQEGTGAVTSAAETQQEFGEISTRRAYDYFKKNRNAYKKEIGRMFGVPGKDISVLDTDIDAYAKEYFENGAVSESTKNRLFEDAWDNGIVVDDTNAQLGKEIRAQLKKQTLYIDPNSARDIPDFGKFRLSQMGNMTLSMQRGYSVDAMYQELSESYGNLFPADITASSDRLLKISEVMAGLTEERYSLDTLYGAEQKADYKQEFLKNTAGFEKVLGDVVRYEADKTPGNGNAEGKVNKDIVKEQKLIEQSIAKVTARSQGGSRLYERVYEDNVNVKVTDACFMKLSHKYKVERDELKNKILELNQQLAKISEVRDGKEHFLSCVRNFVEMNEVTPMILQELIEKIEVHAVEGTGLNCTQSVVIHYKFIGELDMPENFDKIKVNTRKGVEVEYLRTTKMA